MGIKENLREKFAALQATKNGAQPVEPPGTFNRRRDYKGKRGRINLRAPLSLLHDLDVLATACNIDKNSFCVDVLEKAIATRLSAERSRLGSEAWEVIVRCARGEGAKVDGD